MRTATGVVLVGMATILMVCGGPDPQATPGASPTVSAQTPAPDKPSGGGEPIPQDREVTITTDGRSLTVRSQDAVIHLGRPLRFTAQGLRDGQSIEVDFEVYHSTYKGADRYVKGPFAWREHPTNPVRGRFMLDEAHRSVDTGLSDTPGYFKYHVILRDRNRKDITALDPGVIVKNDI
jgi:hypothetical protein